MLNMNHFLKGRNFKLYNIVNANENETRVTVHVTLEFQPMYSFTFSIVLPAVFMIKRVTLVKTYWRSIYRTVTDT